MADVAVAASSSDAGQLTQRLGRFARVTVLIVAILVFGFGAVMLVNSQAIVGSVEERNAHDLRVIAQILGTRQSNFASVARDLYVAGEPTANLLHPEFGTVKIRYGCRRSSDLAEDRLFGPGAGGGSQWDQYRVQGTFVPFGGAETDLPVCFEMQVPLKKLITLGTMAPDLSNMLVVAPDGTVLEQFGDENLPIAKLPRLEASDVFGKQIETSLITGKPQQDIQPQIIDLGDSAGIARLSVNAETYHAYIQPFAMTAPMSTCRAAVIASRTLPLPATQSTPALTGNSDAAPGSAPKPEPHGGPPAPQMTDCQLYLVGLMPDSVARGAWLAPPTVVLVGFGLALLFVLALLPLGRLLLINNTEAISSIEVVALAVGVMAATAIATLGLLFTIEVAGERRIALDEATRMAKGVAASTARSIDELDVASRRCRGDISKGTVPRVLDANYFDIDGNSTIAAKDSAATEVALSCPEVTTVARFSVAWRSYFRRLQSLPDGSDGRILDQLVGQSDGIDKTILARRGTPLAQRAGAPASKYGLRVATVIPSLVSPPLPPPDRFMVVDVDQTGMLALFHSRRSRATIEKLANAIEAPDAVASQLKQLSQRTPNSKMADVVEFSRRYDGRSSQFVAAPVRGTSWIVLVFYPFDDVDRIAAETTVHALLAATSVTILALAGLALLLVWAPPGTWRAIWPFQNGNAAYPKLAAGAIIAAVAVVALSVPLHIPPVFATLVAAGYSVFALFYLQSQKPNAKPLGPKTERSYLVFVLAMVACVSVSPMIAYWADARLMSRAETDVYRAGSAAASRTEENRRVGQLTQFFAAKRPWFHWPAATHAKATIEEQREHGLTARMLAWQNGMVPPQFDRCTVTKDEASKVGDERNWFCATADRLGVTARPWAIPTPSAWVLIAILTLALAGLMYKLVQTGLEALTGFGIPLGAVTWPTLVVEGPVDKDRNEQPLAAKTLLVAPQKALRDRLETMPDAHVVNLADELLPAGDEVLKPDGKNPPTVPTPWKGMTLEPKPDRKQQPRNRVLARLQGFWRGRDVQAMAAMPIAPANPQAPRLIVSGLELVLRDAVRRRAALVWLERAVSVLATNGQKELKGLVVIAEMAPLERILDAFESFSESDDKRLSSREELRWARLFQDFSTFYFAPIDKLGRGEIRNEELDDNSESGVQSNTGEAVDEDRDGTRVFKNLDARRTLVEEMRWLPGGVVDGVIAHHGSPLVQVGDKENKFPLSPARYRDHYRESIIVWARKTNPVSKEAAVDYLRANLIEHYEQCWAASSFAERVILDAIARNSFINMRKAVALQSLVRRGLVILDPAPRLMNHSFSLYLRQNERPDALINWKLTQPRSAWAIARLPLALVLPVLIALLAAATSESGQSLSALVPLVAAGVPALVSMVVRPPKAASGGQAK